MKESNPYNKLFEERIIFLGVQVDDASANDIMAQLLVLESLDPDRDITMYINSPGGSFTSLMAIYDTMQYVRADIQTVCLGQAASAAAVLLGGGYARQAPGAAERPHPDPPAVARRRHPGPVLRPGDPGRRDRAHAHADGGHAGPPHRQGQRRQSARTPTATRSSPPQRPRSTGSSTPCSSTASCRRRTPDRRRRVVRRATLASDGSRSGNGQARCHDTTQQSRVPTGRPAQHGICSPQRSEISPTRFGFIGRMAPEHSG